MSILPGGQPCIRRRGRVFAEIVKKGREANDPIALQKIGHDHYKEHDYESAFRYYTMAAEEGDEDARFRLGAMYCEGRFVEKNEDKCIHHWEIAAVRGHVGARNLLGHLEWVDKRFDRAVKHWIICAYHGHVESIQELKSCYKEGHVTKDDFARALRAYQAAVDAMKSPQREKAEIYFQGLKNGM